MQKRLLARVGAIATVIVATGTLAGCTFGNRGTVGNPENSTVNFNTENGTGSLNFSENGVSISGTDGNSTASFGQELPNNWPDDLPQPSDATLTFAGSSVEDDETSFSAIYTSTQSVENALADMKSKFISNGWTVEGDYNASYSGSVSAGFSATKGDNSASVLIGSDTTQQGQLSITIGGSFK